MNAQPTEKELFNEAQDVRTPASRLAVLADENCPYSVREAVARNPSTEWPVLAYLLSAKFAEAVLSNPALPT